jgi:polar amino acid transport system substrate-binding protein
MLNMNRRQFIAGSMLFAAPTILGLAGCGSSEVTWDGKNFKHGFDKDFPPYSYIDDNGDTTGFDVELAQAVCAHYGWEYVPVPINWDSKDAELSSGSCDCIWSGFTKSPAREDSYCWSEPYSINTQMIMVKEDSDIKTLADLAGKKVGVQTGTSAYDMLETPEADGGVKELADTFASVEVFDTYTIAVTDLLAGAIDAVAIDVTTGNFQMSNQEGLKYLDEELGDEVYAIGFRVEDTALRDKVDEALVALAEDGTMDTIGQKYTDIYDSLSMINKG